MATLAVWQRTIADAAGNVQPNAAITVLRSIAGQPPAACFANRDGTGPLGSTFNAGPDGFVRFFAAGGAYHITATSGAFSATWEYEAIGTAAETDAGLIPTSISTGWLFDDATADADPGSGLFRLNNATPGSATVVYIDNENAGGNSVTAWLDTLDDSGESAARGQLIICDPDQPTEVFRIYTVTGTVTDGTGYRKVSVTHITGAGSFTEGTLYSFEFRSKGVTGEVPNARTLTAGAGLTGGGDLSVNRTFDVGAGTGITVNVDDVAIDKASDAEVRSGSATPNQVITNDLIESASALVTLTDAATVAVNWDTGINFTLTVTANRVIGNPTNGQPGTWRTIFVFGNDGTDRTLTFGNQYLGELPTLTNIDNVQSYLLMIFCVSTTHFTVSAKESS